MPPSRPSGTGRRPRLDPAVAEVRRAVREALAFARENGALTADALVVVALSGGADSLALAAATAFEAPKQGIRAGAVVVDHGLQPGSAEAAARAAGIARGLDLDPVEVVAASIAEGGGPEDAARRARYAALEEARVRLGADAVLVGHTLDDQAETVLLQLARGSGPGSLSGMAPASGRILRPLLGVRRTTTRRACEADVLAVWDDPWNDDPAFARVRARRTVLPVFEAELGPGVALALARTADLVREDDDALDRMVEEVAEDVCEHSEAGIAVSVAALAANPAALRHRLIRYVVAGEFGVQLQRDHVLAVARLITDWHGQGPLDLPDVRVERRGGAIEFAAARRPSSQSSSPGGS